MSKSARHIAVTLRLRGVKQFMIFLMATLLSILALFHISTVTQAGTISAYYLFANSSRVAISTGWAFTLAFEPTQNFPPGSTVSISFDDNDDGYWCRTPGSMSVVGTTSSPVDLSGGSWAIDQALPGLIYANCTQGSGSLSSDEILIENVGPLVNGVTYGVDVFGNTGVLGTSISTGGHLITLNIDSGALNDTSDFLLMLQNSTSVNITAQVLPLPVCSTNNDCTYPFQICDGIFQCSACTTDAQCSYGDICSLGLCIRDLTCGTNDDCNFPSEICSATNECAPCTLDSECGVGNECDQLTGTCQAIPPLECTVNAQCGYPYEICDGTYNCNPCSTDLQCNTGDVCTNNVCVTPEPLECTVNSQCAYPYEVCNPANVCEPCVVDWQCNTGQACIAGVCQAPYECLTNTDCQFPEEICDIDNECTPCNFSYECGQGNSCEDGLCVAIPPAECTTNTQCEYPSEVCIDGSCTQCVFDTDCSGEDLCQSGICEPPPPLQCTVNEHCNFPKFVCSQDNKCKKCANDDECGVGYECKPTGCLLIQEFDGGEPVVPVSAVGWWENLLDDIGLEPERFQEAIQDVAEIAPVAYVANVATSAFVSMGLLNMTFLEAPVIILRGAFGLLTLLGIRLRGQQYGYVYNAVTKEPLANALVRLFKKDERTNKKTMVRTSVTDAFGVFDAELEPGIYSIIVSKSGYKFPSWIVRSLADYPLDNVYHGDEFEVNKEVQIYYSIPVDPTENSFAKVFTALLKERVRLAVKFLQLLLLAFGFSFSLLLLLSIPVFVNFVICLLYIPTIFLTLFSLRYTPPEMGVVNDSSGNPIKGLSIGLYDLTQQRYISKRVTDSDGKFRFVVPRGSYVLKLLDRDFEIVARQENIVDSKREKDMIVIADRLTVATVGA